MDTILLAVDTWDYCLDASGNWALAKAPYALAQDVSSAIRLFLGELWYDDTQGVPYKMLLGETPPLGVVQDLLVTAALTVPDVVSAVCIIQSFHAANRQVVGQVQFTDDEGNTGTVTL